MATEIDLSNLKPPKGAHRNSRRLGRGPGSGRGKTSARGHKGQYSRSGSKRRAHKEGGQMPLHRRLPKRGFFNHFRVEYQVVNVAGLAAPEVAGEIDVDTMKKMRLVRSRTKPVKVLGDGAIDRPIVVSAHAFTRTAREKIEKAGGRCETIIFTPAGQSSQKASSGSSE